MSAERDIGLDEKRVYGEQSGRRAAFVAAGTGLLRVDVSADLVGSFGLARHGPAVDVAGDDGRLAVATPEDVLVAIGEDAGGPDGEGFEPTGFGPATAVTFHEGLVAAGDGRVARYDRDGAWTTLSEPGEVRALDGGMVAAAGGVFRLGGAPVGLSDARDVAVCDAVYAATGDGLYWLANGWRPALDGPVETVACTPGGDGPSRAHAASADALYERGDADDRWARVAAVEGRIAGVAYAGAATYAVTVDGTFFATAGSGDGWRDRSLGVRDVRAVAVP